MTTETVTTEAVSTERCGADGAQEMNGNKHHIGGTRAAFVYYLRFMSLSTIRFLAIFVLVLVFVLGLNALLGLFNNATSTVSLSFGLFANVSSIYLLVMGIVTQTYLETMLNFGLTRRQNTCALLLTSALMALALTLIDAVAVVLSGSFISFGYFGEFNLLWSLGTLIYGWSAYLVGWFIIIGYQYHRALAAIFSTAIGSILYFFVASRGELITPLTQWAYDTLSSEGGSLLLSGICLLVSLALALAIIPLTRRIPIKV
jgi:hypothetical protein